jgi:hypothetical protein
MTLDRLDVVMAFVVIITGVSVLVTILTQTISSVLGLRGINPTGMTPIRIPAWFEAPHGTLAMRSTRDPLFAA